MGDGREALTRLAKRGAVRIDGDDRGFSLAWWPRGQAGNGLCQRGGRASDLDSLVALLATVEADTRPLWRSIDDAKEFRIDDEARQRAQLARLELAIINREDRARHRRDYLQEQRKAERVAAGAC